MKSALDKDSAHDDNRASRESHSKALDGDRPECWQNTRPEAAEKKLVCGRARLSRAFTRFPFLECPRPCLPLKF
jgi:hypothetical protein